jgi:hypothetical protein
MLMRGRTVLLVACALAGCQSTLKGVKLDEAGTVSSDSGRRGIPYALTRPKFTVVKDDKDKYSVTVGYVPDASQRYSLRLDPAIFADTTFKMTWGEHGDFTGLTAKATDQVLPTAVALINLAADVATGLAAPVALGANKTLDYGCLSKAATADVLTCAMRNADLRAVGAPAAAGNPAPTSLCPAGTVKEFERRLKPFKAEDGTDKGDAVGSLYAMTPSEEACFRAAATEIEEEAKEALGDAPPKPTKPTVGTPKLAAVAKAGPFKVDPIRTTAVMAFDNARLGLPVEVQSRWYDSPVITKTREKLVAGLEPKTADDLRALNAAVDRYEKGERAAFYKLLGLNDCQPPAASPPGAVAGQPAAPAPVVDCTLDDVASGSVNEALGEAGLNTKPVGEPLDRLGRAEALSKGLKLAAALPTSDWRKRRIAQLDREEAEAIKTALMTAPESDPDKAPNVQAARERKAAVVGLLPEYKRLSLIRARLDKLPSEQLTTRLSPTSEYAALRTEGERIETLIAARLAVEAPPTPTKTAPEELPPDAPWVSEQCVLESKNKIGWSYIEGKEAPDYVIVLRRADGSRKSINPKDAGCGA